MTTRTAVTGDRIHPGGEYHALPDPVSDRMFSVLMALAAEVWTVRDRLRIAETTLAEHGIAVEQHFADARKDESELAAMASDRDAFVARLLRPLTPSDTR
jgi:hypothetical protein